jgi:hypothetical protein
MRYRDCYFSPRILRSLLVACSVVMLLQSGARAATDWSAFRNALGTNGIELPNDVLRFPLVRDDLTIKVSGRKVSPALFASGFISATPTTLIPLSGSAPISGQAASTREQFYFIVGAIPAEDWNADPVARALRTCTCIQITSIMNHGAKSSPNMVWVHFEGTGTAKKLTDALVSALAIVDEPQRKVNSGAIDLSAYVPSIYQALYHQGTMEYLNDVYVFTLPRPEESLITIGVVPAVPAFGVGQTVVVQSLDQAVASKHDDSKHGDSKDGDSKDGNSKDRDSRDCDSKDGDSKDGDSKDGGSLIFNAEFALRGDEVQPVSDALRAGGFQISAQGIHYFDDNVRLYFVHAFVSPEDPATAEQALANALSLIHSHHQ